ncbi:hypothetical protein Fcan01_26003 [Folsomia candida]|uniref:Uncharacterized protein n=1 Tax=Folsomia candida TaxID=158441 RepID=A0A226D1U0_FOLCA|nr:hypothetical protein Fcan01_26003 [Folsomia candida]
MGSVSNLKCFSGEDFLFDGLPTEVKNIVSFDYKLAPLTDQTARNVLPFSHHIRTIQVNQLLNRDQVLRQIKPFGVISSAEKIILGEQIDAFVVRKVLKNATDVEKFALDPVDPRVGEVFLGFRGVFSNVTEFELKLNLTTSQLKEEKLFLRKLSSTRKFPNLLSYNVDWNLVTLRTVEQYDEALLLHSIYISLHNFLHTHRTTVQKIRWDFGKLDIPGLYDYAKNMTTYVAMKEKMSQVALKEVTVKLGYMEGDEHWDLNTTMLRNQFSLTKVAFTGNVIPEHETPSRLHSLDVTMDVLMENNKSTLTDIYVHNRIFSFYCIEHCNHLRKLALKGGSIISTRPLNHISVPKGLEELHLDFKFIFQPDIINLLDWFPKLGELKVLTIQLNMRWTAFESFPTFQDFHQLLKPPKLCNLIFHFDATTAYKLHVLKQKVADLEARFRNFSGLRITYEHSLDDNIFTLRTTLDRNLFKGIETNNPA